MSKQTLEQVLATVEDEIKAKELKDQYKAECVKQSEKLLSNQEYGQEVAKHLTKKTTNKGTAWFRPAQHDWQQVQSPKPITVSHADSAILARFKTLYRAKYKTPFTGNSRFDEGNCDTLLQKLENEQSACEYLDWLFANKQVETTLFTTQDSYIRDWQSQKITNDGIASRAAAYDKLNPKSPIPAELVSWCQQVLTPSVFEGYMWLFVYHLDQLFKAAEGYQQRGGFITPEELKVIDKLTELGIDKILYGTPAGDGRGGGVVKDDQPASTTSFTTRPPLNGQKTN